MRSVAIETLDKSVGSDFCITLKGICTKMAIGGLPALDSMGLWFRINYAYQLYVK